MSDARRAFAGVLSLNEDPVYEASARARLKRFQTDAIYLTWF